MYFLCNDTKVHLTLNFNENHKLAVCEKMLP